MIKKVDRTFYPDPRFPDYPYPEWESRIARARKLMAENGVDCLVVWERENNRYFFGFQTIHWCMKSIHPAVGIIPLEGEPIIIVPNLFQGNAEGLTWAKDIRVVPDPHQPKVQRELPGDVAKVIQEIGYGNKRIAWESGPLGCMYIPRPVNDIDALRAALPEAKFVDGDKVIWGCRMIKSALEIDRIQRSVHATIAVELAIVAGYRPGMSEVDLMKIINRAAAEQEGMRLGDDNAGWAHFICSADKASMADIQALEGAPITRDHAIQYDGTCYYKGYGPDNCRIWQVGPITPEIKRAYDTIFTAEDASADMLKAGVKANEIYEAMYRVVREAGYKDFDMGGHGTGIDSHEPPSIDAWNEQMIEEGMVLSIEPWFTTAEGGLFGIQDTYVVTKTGCIKIDGLDRNIIQVYHPFD